MIAEGHFGTVHRARYHHSFVVVKVLKPSLNMFQEFQRELHMMTRIRPHPNIVRFMGAFVASPPSSSSLSSVTSRPQSSTTTTATTTTTTTTAESAFLSSTSSPSSVTNGGGGVGMIDRCGLVMEYVDGGSLLEVLIEQKSFAAQRDLFTVLSMLIEAAAGLAHLHAEHIVHRDVAARNFLIDRRTQRVQLSDFGMSRLLQPSNHNKIMSSIDDGDCEASVNERENEQGSSRSNHKSGRTVSAIGPIAWMAPESLLHRTYSCASDVWMFACFVWEVFARKSPPTYFYLGDAKTTRLMTPTPIQLATQRHLQPSLHPILPIPLPNLQRRYDHFNESKEQAAVELGADVHEIPVRLETLLRECWRENPDERPSMQQVLHVLIEQHDGVYV